MILGHGGHQLFTDFSTYSHFIYIIAGILGIYSAPPDRHTAEGSENPTGECTMRVVRLRGTQGLRPCERLEMDEHFQTQGLTAPAAYEV